MNIEYILHIQMAGNDVALFCVQILVCDEIHLRQIFFFDYFAF